MSAKRISTTSILVVLTLLVSFLSALLPLTLSPHPAYATTTTVYFTYNASNASCPINSSNGHWTVPTGVTSVIVLVVAGGGGGGGGYISMYDGGGGGAGGLIYDAAYSVTPGNDITVTVGGGGNGCDSNNDNGQSGGNSSFGTYQAAGGGAGGGDKSSGSFAGHTGGSGGGGAACTLGAKNGASSNASGQGNKGGNGLYSTSTCAGGGGGSGGAGQDGYTTGHGGAGGAGTDKSSIFGTGVGASGWFAGGGGGAGSSAGGSGSNGGGNGKCEAQGDSATGNGSGGGAGGGSGYKGGKGSSGIVIIKYTTYTLTYTAGSNGSINGSSPQTVTAGGSGTAVTAVPNACYHFVNWSDVSTQNPRTDTNVQADISVTANFAINTSTLTYTPGSHGSISGTSPQTVNCGASGSAVTANPDSCYHFVNWSDSNTSNPRTDSNVQTDITVTANFAINTSTLTINASPPAGGSPTGGGSYNCGTNASVVANTNSGYSFVNWTATAGASNLTIFTPNSQTSNIMVNGTGTVTANFALSNSAPTIGTVALWTTGDTPSEITWMNPQVEYNIKVRVTDNDTLNDLVTVKATLYYDAAGGYDADEVPEAGNTQTCAILTWTNGGSPSAWTIDPASDSTWTIEIANCVQPSLANTTETFEFHFKPGKVATQTTGFAKWHIHVVADDGTADPVAKYQADRTMNPYGEVVVNVETVNWDDVDAGLNFSEGDPSEETVSVTYICNGAYNQQVKASTPWTGIPSGNATLNTGGTPGANEFSLKADDDDTLDGAITVLDSYQTFNAGEQTVSFDKALEFNGINQSVITSTTVPTNTFTFEAWVKAVNTHEIDAELSQYGGTSGQCYVFGAAHKGSDAGAGLSVGTNGISVYEHGDDYMPPVAVYNGSLGTGWNHIAVVYNNKQPSIYLNGDLVRTGNTSPKSTVYAPYQIGLGSYGAFQGRIEEVRIWNTALTQQQIRDNMYGEIPDPTSKANLTGYWKFNSNSEDSSQYNNDGTLDPAGAPPQYVDSLVPGIPTAECGNTEAYNSLWLSIGTPFTKATYNGTIYYQVAQ